MLCWVCQKAIITSKHIENVNMTFTKLNMTNTQYIFMIFSRYFPLFTCLTKIKMCSRQIFHYALREKNWFTWLWWCLRGHEQCIEIPMYIYIWIECAERKKPYLKYSMLCSYRKSWYGPKLPGKLNGSRTPKLGPRHPHQWFFSSNQQKMLSKAPYTQLAFV